MSQTAALLLLFIVLPLIVTPLVVWIVVRRAPEVPVGHRISELLDHGEDAEAELLEWKNKGPFLFDSRPMVEYRLSVKAEGDPYELRVTQSTPRTVLAGLTQGMTVRVRVSPDRAAGAIVLPNE